MVRISLSLLATLALASLVDSKDFKSTCRRCWAEKSGFSCQCDGSTERAYIDLDSLLGNVDGNLVWKSGGYWSTCYNCFIYPNGDIFGCSCGKGNNQGYNDARIALNSFITNVGGHLLPDGLLAEISPNNLGSANN